MPLFVAALIGALISALGTIVGRVLVSLFIGYASYQGIDTLVTAGKASLFSSVSAQGALVVQLAGVLQIGTCVNIMASAALAKLVVSGLVNGKLTKFVTKG
jgi:hypothetical protein